MNTQAQILKQLEKKVTQKVNNRVDRKVDKKIDEGLDEVEGVGKNLIILTAMILMTNLAIPKATQMPTLLMAAIPKAQALVTPQNLILSLVIK